MAVVLRTLCSKSSAVAKMATQCFVCDLLSVNNTDIDAIAHSVQDIADYGQLFGVDGGEVPLFNASHDTKMSAEFRGSPRTNVLKRGTSLMRSFGMNP